MVCMPLTNIYKHFADHGGKPFSQLAKYRLNLVCRIDFNTHDKACNNSDYFSGKSMRFIAISLLVLNFSGCSTALAIADGVGTVAVYGVKTVVNTVDAVTPDIVNKKK